MTIAMRRLPQPAVCGAASAQRACLLAFLLSLGGSLEAQRTTYIERLDPALDALIAPDATIERLASGYTWAEGPAWHRAGGYLLFSDVPQNTIYRWAPGAGVSVYLRPAGYTLPNPPGREHGSNGLTFDARGRLVMADHGNRQIARLNDSLWVKETIAARHEGRRFNSPNDLVYRSNGDLYFTDPPFGLRQLLRDPARELTYSGVFRVTPDGTTHLVARDLDYPNGIAFSPDERVLYVANAEPARPIWMAYDVLPGGGLGNGRVFFDAMALVRQGKRGLPDGMRVDREGNLFATGPGGVLIISATGKHLGTIVTGEPTANCTFGEDGRVLYITANNQLQRVVLRTRGAGY